MSTVDETKPVSSTSPPPFTAVDAPETLRRERAFVAAVAIADSGSRQAIGAYVLPLDATTFEDADREADELVREDLADRSLGFNEDGSLPSAEDLALHGGYSYWINILTADEVHGVLDLK